MAVANEIYMKLRIEMASSHSGAFAKTWFLGTNGRKRKSDGRQYGFYLSNSIQTACVFNKCTVSNLHGGVCAQ
jgi:hypothetical protein